MFNLIQSEPNLLSTCCQNIIWNEKESYGIIIVLAMIYTGFHFRSILNLSFYLSNESDLYAPYIGTHEGSMSGDFKNQAFSVSSTVLMPKSSISLISVPSLVEKNIGVLSMYGYATFLYLDDLNAFLEYSDQVSDGLFYILNDGFTYVPNNEISNNEELEEMMSKLSEPPS